MQICNKVQKLKKNNNCLLIVFLKLARTDLLNATNHNIDIH